MRLLPHLALALGLASLASLAACGGDDDGTSGSVPPPPITTPDASSTVAIPSADEMASRLQQETGVAWLVEVDPYLGTPSWLVASAPVPVSGTPEEAARQFLSAHKEFFGLADVASELMLVEAAAADGATHVRFDQKVGSTPVVGARVVVQVKNGTLVNVSGSTAPGLAARAITARADKTAAMALAETKAREALKVPAGAAVTMTEPAVVLYPRVTDAARPVPVALAYEASADAKQYGAVRVYVDAESGSFLEVPDRPKTFAASGTAVRGETRMFTIDEPPFETYTLMDTQRANAIRIYTPGPTPMTPAPIVSTDPKRWDEASGTGKGAAVDAIANLEEVDMLLKEAPFSRGGWNGPGSALNAIVHEPTEPQDASWKGGSWMWFGDGGGVHNLRPLSTAFDVVAHEVFHGVTSTKVRFALSAEAAALDEALSDIFALVLDAKRRAGLGLNFTIGEDTHPAGTPGRDVSAQSKTTYFPSVFHRTKAKELPAGVLPTDANDYGSAHENSTIISNAWYLMTIGGTNVEDEATINPMNPIVIDDPIQMEPSARVWWNARLIPTAGYRYIAISTTESARAMGADFVRPAACAWAAVGVLREVDIKRTWNVECRRCKEEEKRKTPCSSILVSSDPKRFCCTGDKPAG